MKFLLPIYLLLINALGFILMLSDKQRAKKNLWRIPEATLMTVAAVGGSLGTLAGMRIFHHKTKHLKFSLGVPLLLTAHVLLSLAIMLFG